MPLGHTGRDGNDCQNTVNVRIVNASEIRDKVRFEDLIEPVSSVFQESSAGLAQNGLIVMFPGQTSHQAGGERAGRRVRLEVDDVEAIRESVPSVAAISPEIMLRGAPAVGVAG